jgi:hypothetical protein
MKTDDEIGIKNMTQLPIGKNRPKLPANIVIGGTVTVTIDEAIAYLNELIALDKTAISFILSARFECNIALADHTTVQATSHYGGSYVGVMGIINGLFGVDNRSYGLIRYVMRDGELIRFERND